MEVIEIDYDSLSDTETIYGDDNTEDFIFKITNWAQDNDINYIIDQERSYANTNKEVLYLYIYNDLCIFSQDTYDDKYENFKLHTYNNIIYGYRNIINYLIDSYL